jgi:hypothetical protein
MEGGHRSAMTLPTGGLMQVVDFPAGEACTHCQDALRNGDALRQESRLPDGANFL